MEQPEDLKKKLFNSALDKEFILDIILDNIEQSIVVTDKNLDILYFNKKAVQYSDEIFGNNISKGSNIWELLPENKLEAAKRIRKKLSNGNPVTVIMKQKSVKGDIRWLKYQGFPVMDKKNQIELVVINSFDVTDLKNIEQKIRISEANYRSIVQSQSELICKFTADGCITFVNNAYCRFFGMSEKEFVGTNIFSHVPKQVKFKMKNDFMKFSPSNCSMDYIERIFGKNGEERWISGTNTALFDHDGNLLEIQMVGKDITEYQNIQDELRKAKEDAEEASRIRSIFLANISHEIRTPLNGILGFSSILKSNYYNHENINEYCTLIEESGQRLLNVMEDILEISALGSGKHVVHNTNVYLPSIIDDLCEFLKSMSNEISQKKIRIKKHVPIPGPNYLFIDGVKLYQIFMKLLNNALKYTFSGEIEFGYFLSRYDTIRFFVNDTGIGIEDNKKELIFEPFRQGDESPTRKYGGSGIGLTIAKSLVEDLGGHLEVESAPGKGSNFYFDLPLNIPYTEVHEPISKKRIDKKYNWEGKKILIVEDTYINYSLFKEFLKTTHAAILPAHTGMEALGLLNENPDIDLVLLDIRLPDVGGYEIARRMKKIAPSVLIIAQTAFSSDSGHEEAYEAGCDGFLLKPITKDTLLNSINKLLRNKIKQSI